MTATVPTTTVAEPPKPVEVTMAKAASVLSGGPALLEGTNAIDLYKEFSAVPALADLAGEVRDAALKLTYSQSNSPTTGLTMYDLSGPAKLMYPVLTPLRNMIPRVDGGRGTQANWKAITGINTGQISAGVSEGNRNAVIATTTADYLAVYRGLGHEANASFEAQYAAQGFDDVKMRAAQAALHSLMISEEKVLLGGNGTLLLGITPTPSLSALTTGGTIATSTQSVICVALTQGGFYKATVAGGLNWQYNRTNADGTTDTINGGVAQKSANSTIAVTGPTGSIKATVGAVRGAMAYAWYWGAAGSEYLGAITTAPLVTITAAATGTQLASAVPAADFSTNSLDFDGLLTLALKPGSGAYWADLGGLPLTADGKGGVVEIDNLLQDRWDNFRINPATMWVSSRESKAITNKIVTGMANTAMRFNIPADRGMLGGGSLVTSYMNSFGLDGATTVNIRQHPNLIPGTILFTQDTVPYPLADTPNLFQVKTRQEYFQIEWPLRSRKYEFGVYVDEVLQHFFTPALGVITGIGAG